MRCAIAFASAWLTAPETLISATSVAPSPSATTWPRQVAADLGERRGNASSSRAAPERAVREQHDRVVRRALAVDRDRVEALCDGGPQELDRLAGCERVVGRDDGEHRREVRDGSSRSPSPSRRRRSRRVATAATFDFVSVVRIASAASSPPSAESAASRGVEAGDDAVHRQRRADHAGREDDDLLGRETEQRRPRARRSRRRRARPARRWRRSRRPS